MNFKCAWVHHDCDFECEDEREEGLLAAAEEHLKTEHPQEAIERERVRGLILGAGRPV